MEELAQLSGVSPSAICGAETAIQFPKLNTIERLCQELNVPSRYLVKLSRGQALDWCTLDHLGPYFRSLRTCSLRQMAAQLDEHVTTICYLELGKNLTSSLLFRAAQAYGRSPLGLYL